MKWREEAWWETAWHLLRDVLMTSGGLTLIYLQAFSGHPSGVVIGAGLVLVAPAGVQHAVTVVLSAQSGQGHGLPPSSPSSPPPASSPASSPAEAPREPV